ncbi:hypothetical protein HaLaN_29500 [Haematococcus lacustris]|uniref:Uncharacterized protein n=1 Tax=Haematococcus lacustris TaxID=44745 RepID=A0A6A0AD36_HAELA|nr:hypothetical protein HaLaN_29500 [Haematococcus lacustris]
MPPSCDPRIDSRPRRPTVLRYRTPSKWAPDPAPVLLHHAPLQAHKPGPVVVPSINSPVQRIVQGGGVRALRAHAHKPEVGVQVYSCATHKPCVRPTSWPAGKPPGRVVCRPLTSAPAGAPLCPDPPGHLECKAVGGIQVVALEVTGAVHLPCSARLVVVNVEHSVPQASRVPHHWHCMQRVAGYQAVKGLAGQGRSELTGQRCGRSNSRSAVQQANTLQWGRRKAGRAVEGPAAAPWPGAGHQDEASNLLRSAWRSVGSGHKVQTWRGPPRCRLRRR